MAHCMSVFCTYNDTVCTTIITLLLQCPYVLTFPGQSQRLIKNTVNKTTHILQAPDFDDMGIACFFFSSMIKLSLYFQPPILNCWQSRKHLCRRSWSRCPDRMQETVMSSSPEYSISSWRNHCHLHLWRLGGLSRMTQSSFHPQ